MRGYSPTADLAVRVPTLSDDRPGEIGPGVKWTMYMTAREEAVTIADMRLLLASLLVSFGASAAPARRWSPPSPAISFNKYEQEVFDVSMQINDWAWDWDRGLVASDADGVRNQGLG